MNPILITADPDHPILRLDLDPNIGAQARDMFLDAAESFEDEIDEEIAFDPGYTLGEGEAFVIEEFAVPDALLTACQQPLAAERLHVDQIGAIPIKGIAGFDFSQGQRRIFFQNFNTQRVLIPGQRFALFGADQHTFRELQHPVLILESQISAVWDDGDLVFRSFHLAKQIFDLSAYFNEATNEQLGQFAGHPRIACPNVEQFVSTCTQWSRKKIALILRGGILAEATTEALLVAGESVGYEVPLDGDRIVLPVDTGDLKRLLQFLDEDIYRGPISQRTLISSGKRVIVPA